MLGDRCAVLEIRVVAGMARPDPAVEAPFTRPCGVVDTDDLGAADPAEDSLVDEARWCRTYVWRYFSHQRRYRLRDRRLRT